MSLWATLQELLDTMGSDTAARMPTLDEARYRIDALRAGDPVSGRGPGMGALTPGVSDYLEGSLDAITPIPVGAGTMLTRDAANTLKNMVSSRFPTSPKGEDPMLHDLIVSLGSQQMDPAAYQKTVEGVLAYPQVPAGTNIEDYIERARENLNFLYDRFEPELRSRASQWYPGANLISRRAAERYGTTPEAAAAVYATQSPQKDWFQNVSLGERIMDTMANRQDFGWTREMDQVLDEMAPGLIKSMQPVPAQIRGKTLADLETTKQKALWTKVHDYAHRSRQYPEVTPEGEFGDIAMTQSGGKPKDVVWQNFGAIGKAIDVLEDPHLLTISRNLGDAHKVRSFYNNIIQPWSQRGDVTMDTHAVAAALLQPFGGSALPVAHNLGGSIKGVPKLPGSAITGQQGSYGIHGEAYERAAMDQGILPREMQSITWEAVRGLFNNKSPKMKRAAADIWGDYANGLITHGQAQRQIFDLAGGINPPAWSLR